MDPFSRTMLACSAEAGLTTTALSRHVPLLRRNVRPGDQVSLLGRCVGSDGLGSGDHVLMLTGERIVVTRQSRLLGRVRLCLDAPVSAVENLRWSADPAGPGVELNFTVMEGPGAADPHRWHFWLPASHAKRVWRIDALLARAFRRPKAVARPANAPRTVRPPHPALVPNSVGAASAVFPILPAPMADAVFAEAGEHPASPMPAPRHASPARHAAVEPQTEPQPTPQAEPGAEPQAEPRIDARAALAQAQNPPRHATRPRHLAPQPTDLDTALAIV